MDTADTAHIVHMLIRAKLTVATAESLTGGGLSSRLVDVPGASETLRGGVCAYAADIKASVLGVDPQVLKDHGTVNDQVAIQMAEGIRRLMGADIGISTTGVAGPGPSEGHQAGTVFIACAHPKGVECRPLYLSGSRAQIRAATDEQCLLLLHEVLGTLNGKRDEYPHPGQNNHH